MTTIYHNPRCSNSRAALRLLEENGETIEVIKYLENPLSQVEIKQILELLNVEPIDLIRTKEVEWKDNFAGKVLSNGEIIDAMVKYPKLIERPIVVKGIRAIIARPPIKVLEIL